MSLKAEGGDPTAQRNVYAYAFLTNAAHSSSVLDTVISALSSALEPHLKAVSTPIALSHRIFYQPFVTASSDFAPLDIRTYRQAPACISFEKAYSAELVLIPGSQGTSDGTGAAEAPLRLAVFDMDSTLIDQEVIDELAAQVGRKAEVQAITERAMRGEIDFSASLRERVAMLRGARTDVWEQLKGRISIAQGARELCAALKRHGVRMAVLSGGFQPMAEWLKGELGLDVAVANHLLTSPPTAEFNYAHLTGALNPAHSIVDSTRKRTLLQELAAEQGVPLNEALCVGDGANDLPMLLAVGEAGGLALACRAKPKVQMEAPNRLSLAGGVGLADLIWLFDPRGASALDQKMSGK